MRIFITGGSGLLGCKIAEIALEKEYKIYTGYCHNKPEFGELVKFELAKDLDIIHTVKPEVIIHTAALTNVDECEANKALAYELNVEGTKRLVELAKDVGAFFVMFLPIMCFPGITVGIKKRIRLIPLTTTDTRNYWARNTASA